MHRISANFQVDLYFQVHRQIDHNRHCVSHEGEVSFEDEKAVVKSVWEMLEIMVVS